MELRIAVCDDEGDVLKNESEMIRELLDEKNVKYKLDAYDAPGGLISSQVLYDMIFLDIEIGKVNGIDVAEKMLERKGDSYIFFITNYSVYMDRALDIRVHRYLSKPIDRNRLSSGIDSALKKLADSNKIITITEMETKRVCDIPIASVIYIENIGRHTKFFVTSRPAFVGQEVFSKIKAQIESEVDYFAAPHQSYYVNMRFVDNYDKNNVSLSYGRQSYTVEMSRRGYKGFNDKMFAQAKLMR